jgi:hypothetical protein
MVGCGQTRYFFENAAAIEAIKEAFAEENSE